MVNDQLARIHHMRLLAYDKSMTKQQRQQRANASPSESSASTSQPSSSPIIPETLSSSAPETGLLEQHPLSSKHDQSLSPSAHLEKKYKHRRRNSIMPKSQSFSPGKAYASSKKLKDDCLSGEQQQQRTNEKNHGSQQAGNKKKSSWRHLLSPSYKSRSDEFHKFFATEIPSDERLIADYSCALHREILIQGRVYISTNYIAFYSNLFSWITKLVVELRDVADIFKANTARIIPNAIQIVTNSNEKHVFASFIARDKSYIMFWRIWRNNILRERMTDGELRSLVHLTYGKDLGMSQDEELRLNSPELRGPDEAARQDETGRSSAEAERAEALAFNSLDGNNNSGRFSESGSGTGQGGRGGANEICDRSSAIVSGEESASSQSNAESEAPLHHPCEDDDRSHLEPDTRGSNVARFNTQDRSDSMSGPGSVLHETPCDKRETRSQIAAGGSASSSSTASPWSDINGPCSPTTTSSAVILDTPDLERSLSAQNTTRESLEDDVSLLSHRKQPEAEYCDRLASGVAQGQLRNLHGLDSTTSATTVGASNVSTGLDDGLVPPLESRGQEACVNGEQEEEEEEEEEEGEEGEAGSADQAPTGANNETIDLNTACNCQEHPGQLIADEEFDINVDTLFSLIFTNSKFMRAYMIRRGMTDTTVSKWKRCPTGSGANNSSSGGERSNSSTLSRSLEDHGRRNSSDSFGSHLAAAAAAVAAFKPAVKSKQVRQLNYSMNLNHVWAKQIQVEERQNVCSLKPGVYVLKSQSINSGVPCSESFTIDLTYCLTRTSHLNKSRMLVHGGVNFIKDKQNWKVAMVKSVIEKQSVQGLNDFVTDLIGCIREYVAKKRRQRQNSRDWDKTDEGEEDEVGARQRDQDDSGGQLKQRGCRKSSKSGGADESSQLREGANLRGASGRRHNREQAYTKRPLAAARSCTSPAGLQEGARSSRSLARAKSKLKERKLRNIYKYYIHATAANQDTARSTPTTPTSHERDTGGRNRHQPAGSSFEREDSAESSDDSLVSLLDDAADNGSMIMMMAAHETDSSQASQRSRNGRGQSFSDLENGHSLDEEEADEDEDGEVEEGHFCHYRSSTSRNRRQADEQSNMSETSNVTINNNGNIGANYRRRSHVCQKQTHNNHNHNSGLACAAGGEETKVSLGHGHLSSSSQCAGCKLVAAHAKSRNANRRLEHATAGWSLFKKSACHGTRSNRLSGLVSSKNLAVFSLVVMMLLLVALVTLNVLLLQRLSCIETQLLSNCGRELSSGGGGGGGRSTNTSSGNNIPT